MKQDHSPLGMPTTGQFRIGLQQPPFTEKHQTDSEMDRSVGSGRAGRGSAAGRTLRPTGLSLARRVLVFGLFGLFLICHISIRLHATLDPSAEQQKGDQHSQADTNHVLPFPVRSTAAFTLLQGSSLEKAEISPSGEARIQGANTEIDL